MAYGVVSQQCSHLLGIDLLGHQLLGAQWMAMLPPQLTYWKLNAQKSTLSCPCMKRLPIAGYLLRVITRIAYGVVA